MIGVRRYLDTSVVVRHLTGEPPDLGARAKGPITTGSPCG